MKSTVRRIAAPLTALVLAAALSSCGGGDDSGSSSEKKAITLWMYPVIGDQAASDAYWQKVETDFEAANSGIDLKIEIQPWDKRDEKLAAAFAGKKGPDVVLQIPDQLPQYVKNGSFEPVDDVVEPDKDKFLPAAIPGLTVDGKVYAAPIYHTVTTTMYNKTILTKAGISKPPETWDEIKAAAPKIKAAGFSTLDYSASPEASLNLNFYPLLWQAGGKVFADDNKTVAFNQAPGVEALTFLKSLYDQGAIPKSALTNGNLVDRPAVRQGAGGDGLHQYAGRREDGGDDLGGRQRRDRHAADRREAGRFRYPRRSGRERGLGEHRRGEEVPVLHDPAGPGGRRSARRRASSPRAPTRRRRSPTRPHRSSPTRCSTPTRVSGTRPPVR